MNDGGIWKRAIRRWDLKFSGRKIKIAAIADNCTAQCITNGLKSVEFVVLPTNSTYVLQPLDQGIIQNFKANYRKNLLSNI